MSKENQFVQMPEAQTDRIRTTATLPFGLEREIGLNVNKLHTVMQLGGVSFLKIKSEEGERTSVDATIVGMDGQGNALAGKTKVNYIPTSSSWYALERNHENCKQSRWVDMSVTFNTEELKQRLLNTGKKVNDSNNWSIEINKALKKEINKNCSVHLMGGFSTYEKFIVTMLWSGDLLNSMGVNIGQLINTHTMDIHYPAIPRLLLNTFTTGFLWNCFDTLFYGIERKISGRRLSLFYGFELDRLALLFFNTSTSTLAKTLKK